MAYDYGNAQLGNNIDIPLPIAIAIYIPILFLEKLNPFFYLSQEPMGGPGSRQQPTKFAMIAGGAMWLSIAAYGVHRFRKARKAKR